MVPISAALFVYHPFNGRRSNDTPSSPEKSIAVLPFENLSAEKDDAFFADGIQDDVLTTLGKIKELKVTARPSVMAYREGGRGQAARDRTDTPGVPCAARQCPSRGNPRRY